jgi:hypothetical protein
LSEKHTDRHPCHSRRRCTHLALAVRGSGPSSQPTTGSVR